MGIAMMPTASPRVRNFIPQTVSSAMERMAQERWAQPLSVRILSTPRLDVLKEHGFDPTRCVIDHNNEETIREVRDRGYWCAFSIYPNTKMGSERMVAIVKSYGPERLIVDSACDWGVSDPLAVAKTAQLMAQRGVTAQAVHQVVYGNALAVYGLNAEMKEEHWLAPSAIDQRTLYEGNSVLRGGQTPRIEEPGRPVNELQIT